MRIIVFFDLPSVTSSERKEYRSFRKLLLKNGFIMLQESVYSKIALNATVVNYLIEALRRGKPPNGSIQVLTVTEKQYGKIEFIIGERQTTILDSDERLVIL